MTACIDVVVVDGHRLFLRGLALLLEAHGRSGVRVAASTSSPRQAPGLVRRHRPDVALVDLMLSAPGGPGVIRAAKRAHPPLRVLAMSGTGDADLTLEALGAGADGVVAKTCEPEQLLPALLGVAGGYRVLPATIADELDRRVPRPAAALAGDLGDAERDLWLRIARGECTSVIAAGLFVSERTAKRLVAGLLDRLGVATRLEAAAMAGRLGLLDADPLPRAVAGVGARAGGPPACLSRPGGG